MARPPSDEPPPIFPEATVDMILVPGLIRCPVCRAYLEVKVEGADVERLRPAPASRGEPIPIRGNETAPGPKDEGG